VLTFQLTIGHRELRQEPEALPGVANQEVVGHVIVMVASGWSEWPKYPQCLTDAKGRFANVPCFYGGMLFLPKQIEVPLAESAPEPEPLPPWLWKMSR
jgi:hypothetical protein